MRGINMHKHSGYPEQYLKVIETPKIVMSPELDEDARNASIHHINVLKTFNDIYIFNYNHNLTDNVIYIHIGLSSDIVKGVNESHQFLPQYIESLGIVDVTYELLLIRSDDITPDYCIVKSPDRIKYEIDNLLGSSFERDKYATLLAINYKDLDAFRRHIDIIDKLQ